MRPAESAPPPDVPEALRLISVAQAPVSTNPISCTAIYVDLDGTLLRSDLLWESLLSAVRRSPLILLLLPFWLMKGREHLKRELAQRANIDVETLPYRPEILERLLEAKSQSRRIVLATAADESLAREIAAHLQIFDAVLASSPSNGNLKGQAKLTKIQQDSAGLPFAYWGDSDADLPIFAAASEALRITPHGSSFLHLFRAARAYQWVKNLLLFLPVATSHRLLDPLALGQAALSFAIFSLVASGNYLLNDLLDLPSDRRHPSKRLRPLASGLLPIPHALMGMLLLFAASTWLTVAFTPATFWPWIAGYFVLTNFYSFRLKQLLLVDLMALSSLYTIRIMAGGAITGIQVSEWLVAFSMFIFTSLAFAKRFTELKRTLENSQGALRGRAYQAQDLDIVRVAGPVSGYSAIVVMALYINSPTTLTLYHAPQFLWLVCPLLAYWITRIWFLANRGELDHDPIVFALKDPASYAVLAGAAASAAAATLL